MKVLVTGANGFLGSHVVRILIASGYDVKAFILKGTSESVLEGLSYEPYIGDLRQRSDIDAALESCDVVIHTAAMTDIWPNRNELLWTINYDVVKDLAEAVQQQSIKKMIHVGTANSFGFGSLSNPGTEEYEYDGQRYGLDYMDSKKAAQDYLLSESGKEDRLPVTIVNPTFMIGEQDTKPGTGEMILSVIQKNVPGFASGGRCFVPVKDVAQACVNAIEHGEIGQCYIAGGTNLCYKDFFTLIGQIAGVTPPKRKIPTWLAVTFAGILQVIAYLKRTKPLLTRTMAKISGDGHYYSSEKAVRKLHMPQTSLETALEEAITWYKDHGYLKPS